MKKFVWREGGLPGQCIITHTVQTFATYLVNDQMQQRPGGGFQQQPNMGTPPGPQMMPRPQQQAPYSPMRQGGMTPQSNKRPADNRPPQQKPQNAPRFDITGTWFATLLLVITNQC